MNSDTNNERYPYCSQFVFIRFLAHSFSAPQRLRGEGRQNRKLPIENGYANGTIVPKCGMAAICCTRHRQFLSDRRAEAPACGTPWPGRPLGAPGSELLDKQIANFENQLDRSLRKVDSTTDLKSITYVFDAGQVSDTASLAIVKQRLQKKGRAVFKQLNPASTNPLQINVDLGL